MPEWLPTVLMAIIQIAMVVGLLGLFIPGFPGILIIWGAALVYGFISGFNTIGIVIFVVITLLMIVGVVIDNILMGVGARKGGASWWAIVVAFIGAVAGTLIYPPFGGFIIAPLAILLFEYIRIRNLRKAWKAFLGFMSGWGLSFLFRFGIGFVMMALWWLWVWKG